MDYYSTYLQYGVSTDFATTLQEKGISVTTFRQTSKKLLINNYKLEKALIDFVKDCISRHPIDKEIVQQLLENNNFTCCACKGVKSDSYIVHHIEEYSKSQDNSYDNLALLCLNDHELAHREGISLSNKLTKEQIKSAKLKWETQVKSENEKKASLTLSEFSKLDQSTVNFSSINVENNQAKNIEVNHELTKNTRLILKVTQTKPEQEFICYISICTDTGDQKWIGFGTPTAIKNVFQSERVFRIGRPGKLVYETVEHMMERIDESGLKITGKPIHINTVRVWGWHENNQPILFEYFFDETPIVIDKVTI